MGRALQYSTTPGKVAPWWVYELKQPRLGSYIFTASLSFRQGEKAFSVLDNCKLALPLPNTESETHRLNHGVEWSICRD